MQLSAGHAFALSLYRPVDWLSDQGPAMNGTGEIRTTVAIAKHPQPFLCGWNVVLAFVVSAGLIAYLLWRILPRDLAQQMSRLHLRPIVTGTVLFVATLYFRDALSFAWLFRPGRASLHYFESHHARGSSYLLNAINYELGQAWLRSVKLLLLRIVYYLHCLLYMAVGLAVCVIPVSLETVCSVIPLVLLVDGLPITVSGLGTRETALVYLLVSRQQAELVAFSLDWSASLILGRSIIAVTHRGVALFIDSPERSV